MSLQTWKDEFYPVPITTLDLNALSDSDAVAHSLLKWQGLSEQNLKNHFVFRTPYYMLSDSKEALMRVDSSSCALCARVKRSASGRLDCSDCPIYRINGVECHDAYASWIDTFSNMKMVNLLETTLKGLQDES